jgi:hypothetical protein
MHVNEGNVSVACDWLAVYGQSQTLLVEQRAPVLGFAGECGRDLALPLHGVVFASMDHVQLESGCGGLEEALLCGGVVR